LFLTTKCIFFFFFLLFFFYYLISFNYSSYFFIIPAKRKKAKEEMRRKIAAVRERLSTALREQFGREVTASGDRIREGIAPYSRFVRAEGDSLKAAQKELADATAALAGLRSRIEQATAPSAESSTGTPTAH